MKAFFYENISITGSVELDRELRLSLSPKETVSFARVASDNPKYRHRYRIRPTVTFYDETELFILKQIYKTF